ncbi:MAG TPA: DUF6559 family protein [Verrucomicrobiae bacterium]|jgi:hypothetical protein|nr:DUF6559 family protein [Verrucomicrobiae bacterium]
MFRLIKRRIAIRSYVFKLSQKLSPRFGKKSHYSIEEVTETARDADFSMAYIAYAHAIFCNRTDFEAYYEQLRVRCTYDDLRATVSRRYFKGIRDFDAASVITATKRTNEGNFYESGIGT